MLCADRRGVRRGSVHVALMGAAEREQYGGHGGLAVEHLPRNSPAGKDHPCDHEEPCGEVLRDVRRDRRDEYHY